MNPIYKELENKKILILGFGKEGKSTYEFIRKQFKEMPIGIADKNTSVKDDEKLMNDKNVTYHLGTEHLESIKDYEVILKSPGIVIDDLSNAERITSQTDLFLKHYSKNVIGVTATKGKTTTVTLLTHILKNAKRDVLLVGNIGFPVFDKLEEIKEDTIVVYELSSFQLEYIHNSPHISAILNQFQDHMDIHGTMEKYISAKFNITKFQSEDDIFIYNVDNDITKSFGESKYSKAKKISISQKFKDVDAYVDDEFIVYNGEKVYDLRQERNLIGTHINYNLMVVIIVSKMLGVNNDIISDSIRTYVSEPHRLEFVGAYDGIKFYNDSIATVPEPTMEGVKALKEVDTLILGGYDKGVEYGEIAEFLLDSDVRNILCMYDTGKKIYDIMYPKNKTHNLQYLTGIEEAVKVAKEVTEKGKICLMSPASASFGAFKDYKERGDIFRELVKRGKK